MTWQENVEIVRLPPLLDVTGLTRSFGARDVLQGVHLTLQGAERLALTGPNGSGKTTLLRCICGSIAPSSGAVAIDGETPERARLEGKVGVALGDHRSFYLRLTARENLTLFARLRLARWDVRSPVAGLEQELGLGQFIDKPVGRCSSGMVQRLALARALIGAPRLLLLDEPTRSMDEDARALAWAALDRRPDTGVVLATHDPEEVDRCGQQLDLTGETDR